MKCTKLLSKLSKNFWGLMKCTNFVMDEMYEIGQFLAELEYEYCGMWLFGLSVCVCMCVFSFLVCMKVLMLSFIKLGCTRCRCGMKEYILNFALPPLCLVYIKFLMSSVIKLGCKRCIDWKR